jgi:NAD(P)-dependent dehydrogenase (short-subunit alcohol dehydrogenase family)
MALGLLDAGARVAAIELDAPAIDETQDALEDRGAGQRFLGIGADVTHDEALQKSYASRPNDLATSIS